MQGVALIDEDDLSVGVDPLRDTEIGGRDGRAARPAGQPDDRVRLRSGGGRLDPRDRDPDRWPVGLRMILRHGEVAAAKARAEVELWKPGTLGVGHGAGEGAPRWTGRRRRRGGGRPGGVGLVRSAAPDQRDKCGTCGEPQPRDPHGDHPPPRSSLDRRSPGERQGQVSARARAESRKRVNGDRRQHVAGPFGARLVVSEFTEPIGQHDRSAGRSSASPPGCSPFTR